MTEFRFSEEYPYYVYVHYRNDNGQPFYVGVGKKPSVFRQPNREYLRAYAKTSRTLHWKNIVKKYGYTIEIIVENIPSVDEAFSKEKEMIALYGRIIDGGLLCNYTMGGEGAFGRVCSEESKKRIGNANRGKKHSKELVEIQATTFKNNHSPLVTCLETGKTFRGFSEVAKAMFPEVKYAAKCIADSVKAVRPYKGFHFTSEPNPKKSTRPIGAVSPLSEPTVSAIKQTYNKGMQIKEIAKLFNLAPITIRRIKQGHYFKEVLPKIDLTTVRLPIGVTLSEEDIRNIRGTRNGKMEETLDKFKIGRKLFFEIKKGRAWKNVI